jgi:hypothetical protein
MRLFAVQDKVEVATNKIATGAVKSINLRVCGATAQIEDANLKMTRYRAALDAGGDPEEIGKWIAEAKAQRLKAEAQRCQATNKTTLTRQQVQELIDGCADIAANLRDADPVDTASVYRKFGLRLTYHPAKNLLQAAACPQPGNIGR